MASFKNPFLFIIVSFLNYATTQAQDTPTYLYQNCSSNPTTINSPFQLNLKTLLSSLSSEATIHPDYYNTTIMGDNPTDSAYGLFMCRGDVPPLLCQQCIQNATQQLSTQCSLSKQAVIWYDECMVRFSNRSFFSTVNTSPEVCFLNTANVSNPESFKRLLLSTMNQTAEEAARPPIGEKKYATKEADVSGFQTLYCLAQCTPDLSPIDCRTCLSTVIRFLPKCSEGKQGGRVLFPSCNVRYELYPFYRSIAPSPTPIPALVPASNFSDVDSKFSDDPTYLSHNCSINKIADDTFKNYLKTLLSYLSSNATGGNKFHTADVKGTVYGLFMCLGDLPSGFCEQCVLNATNRISSDCYSFQEAIIWYSHCMLRYSYQYILSKVEKSPIYSKLNITSNSMSYAEQNFFTFILSNTLAELVDKAGSNNDRYATESSKLDAKQTLYTLAQCTPDLSSVDCSACLKDVIGTAIPWSRLGSIGGRVLYPSCILRFELFQFYMDGEQVPPPTVGGPSPSDLTDKRKGQLRRITLIVVPITVFVTLFFSGLYLIKRKGRKSHRTILRENFGPESATLEPLQFSLAVIEEATNHFSYENRIGKGGFGEVFKGILSDGREIAVKRLSKISKQGANEFKNEVLLIAKLQHRNLVTFIGFCLEEQDKILVYEYVQNKSLDYFLFDSQRSKMLSWSERFNIIGGIARGILYLHEYSRLKVIHRDLKPSNILLDENMIPKISDFGLARIVEINQDQENTNRIVGTYGYMSPEYAMLGQFSEKSDIYSFGVMVLEIITGKKNLNSYEPHGVVDGLLNYVWRQWRDQTPLNILDLNIKDNYSENEIIKCIQIGLLCVQENPDARPIMATIVSYLSSYSIDLPAPREPAFCLEGRMDSTTFTHESSSSQCTNNFNIFSVNEMSTGEFLPR